MHEFSLASGIVTIVEEMALKEGWNRIENVKLVVGSSRMVHVESLQFAFSLLIKESMLNGASLEIEERIGYDFYIDYMEGE
ncbi:hydrogenase maturation nickel metallochaperone HypA [Ammoniphilus sp. CFH 90114]|uniref:hydrogenase maturation nickel metallochaperone HypA/HybF n=1 Tax=Ammoniphilus sp. CFH 90114 TaxID=2493665 RepID=UPI00100E66AD|nr:hydrogenase maturation nickel metallochaperone HypA [Ammoniphilus sp. CFH 90114]RXT07957.1 hydrogenase maturation nickel metallochaperone HypA [Ammoniphilus sp. CFH 90114]